MSTRGATLDIKLQFIVEECCSCGMAFAMTNEFEQRRLNDHQWFYCPAGHQQYYSGKSDADKLRDKLKQAEARHAALRAETDQAWAAANEQLNVVKEKEREIKRITKRANAGECLQCKRHFVDVEAHVKRKHPAESPSHLGEHEELPKKRKVKS